MKKMVFLFLFLGTFSNLLAQSIQTPANPEDISPLLIGESLPNLILKNTDNQDVELSKLFAQKKTVLIFYRGGWCPFCNKQLADLQTHTQDLIQAGFQIVAISPDAPAQLKATMDKNKLDYLLLSDNQLSAAKSMGLAFKAPEKYGDMLKKSSDNGNVEVLLPVPAVFLVDTKGVIQFEHISPNYKERLNGKVLLAIAKSFNNTETK